jgi:peroxiredoxin
METSQWVDEKLRALHAESADVDGAWQPSAARALNHIRVRRQQPGSGRSRWIWASATVLACGLGSLAFPAPRAAAERVLAPCVGACEILFMGKTEERRSTTITFVPVIGAFAPEFALTGADGAAIRLADYRGKVVLLNFWATWCPPCRAEIPWFVEFEREYAERGLAVIGISMDKDGWKAVRPFQKAHGIQYALGIGSNALARKFGGVESLPQTLLIGRDGKIVANYSGIVRRTEYQSAIEKLLLN